MSGVVDQNNSKWTLKNTKYWLKPCWANVVFVTLTRNIAIFHPCRQIDTETPSYYVWSAPDITLNVKHIYLSFWLMLKKRDLYRKQYFSTVEMLTNSFKLILPTPNEFTRIFAMFSFVTVWCGLPERVVLFVRVQLRRISGLAQYLTAAYAGTDLP